MKRLLMFIASLVLLVAFVLPETTYADDKVIDEKLGVPIVVYGADLSAAEKESVKKV